MKRYALLLLALVVAALLHAADARAFAALWLIGWWWALGIVMGALVSVWIHALTGGEWGEQLRAPLLRIGRAMPFVALLALPLAFALEPLYPWAQAGSDWSRELSAPAFKLWWLQPAHVLLRGALFVLLCTVLALLTQGPALRRSRAFAALALMLYAIGGSLAATDWLASLMPRFYSAGFGLGVLVGQGLAGLAAALVLWRGEAQAKLLRDFGNMLLAWSMTWAYLAFVQLLIVWSEDLPHEILWYRPRLDGPWQPLAWLLLLGQLALPFALLLFRSIKQQPRYLRRIAIGLLVAHALNMMWLVLPSLAPQTPAALAGPALEQEPRHG